MFAAANKTINGRMTDIIRLSSIRDFEAISQRVRIKSAVLLLKTRKKIRPEPQNLQGTLRFL